MVKNIIANFIGKFWSLFSGFVFIPLYIHYLGFESYSIISFGLVMTGLMAILDAGLTATLSREFARNDNCIEDKRRIFRTLESTYFILVIACIVLVFSLSHFIANSWLNLDSYDASQVSTFFKIVSIDIGFQLLLRFYMGGVLGLEEQVKANIYQIGWGMLRNGLVIIPIIFYPKLELFFIWQTLSTILFAILLKFALQRSLSGNAKLYLKPKFEKDVFKKVWKFAGGMLLISLVAGLNSQMDKLAISKLLSLESLGYYTLSISLVSSIIVLVNPISVALLPRFTALFSTKRFTEASLLFHKVNLGVSLLVSSVMANFIFFGSKLIWAWTGQIELANQTTSILPILTISYSLLAIVTIPYNIAIANGYTTLNNILGIASLLMTLPGYWIATKKFGAIGAASVFCLVQFFITIVYIYLIDIKFIRTKNIGIGYMRSLLLPFILSLTVAYVISFLPFFESTNRILTFVIIGGSIIITLLITTSVLLPIKELRYFLKIQLIKSIWK